MISATGARGATGPAGPTNTRAAQATGDQIAVPAGSTGGVTIRQVSIAAPSSGRVVVFFNGFAEASAGSSGVVYVVGQIMNSSSGTPQSVNPGGATIRFTSNGNTGFYAQQFSAVASFSVTTSGTYTFYFRARQFVTTSVAATVFGPNMEAIFIPQ